MDCACRRMLDLDVLHHPSVTWYSCHSYTLQFFSVGNTSVFLCWEHFSFSLLGTCTSKGSKTPERKLNCMIATEVKTWARDLLKMIKEGRTVLYNLVTACMPLSICLYLRCEKLTEVSQALFYCPYIVLVVASIVDAWVGKTTLIVVLQLLGKFGDSC